MGLFERVLYGVSDVVRWLLQLYPSRDDRQRVDGGFRGRICVRGSRAFALPGHLHVSTSINTDNVCQSLVFFFTF
jgi:hypothetical protein